MHFILSVRIYVSDFLSLVVIFVSDIISVQKPTHYRCILINLCRDFHIILESFVLCENLPIIQAPRVYQVHGCTYCICSTSPVLPELFQNIFCWIAIFLVFFLTLNETIVSSEL